MSEIIYEPSDANGIPSEPPLSRCDINYFKSISVPLSTCAEGLKGIECKRRRSKLVFDYYHSLFHAMPQSFYDSCLRVLEMIHEKCKRHKEHARPYVWWNDKWYTQNLFFYIRSNMEWSARVKVCSETRMLTTWVSSSFYHSRNGRIMTSKFTAHLA